jgi:hypothetical protein
MTAHLKGQAGRVNEVLGDKPTNIGVLAGCTGFSRAQVAVALGVLKRAGIVERVERNVWRRVAGSTWMPEIGDRVRLVGDYVRQHGFRGWEGDVVEVNGLGAARIDFGSRGTMWWGAKAIERQPADEPPSKPRPIAWAQVATANVDNAFLTPWQLRHMGGAR